MFNLFSQNNPSDTKRRTKEWVLEIALIAISLGLSIAMWRSQGFQFLVLYLFFLPVVFASFSLGQYRGGVLAFFCVITAGLVVSNDFNQFGETSSPLFTMVALTIWGATLGLTSLLIGTLRDHLSNKIIDSHEAHIGVIEVLSQYLKSANPNWQTRSKRVAEISEKIARRMKLSESEIGNVRVAAMLVDIENVEITSRVIRKAVGELESAGQEQEHSFYGRELVQSLGQVISGIIPLLLEQETGGAPNGKYDCESQLGAEIVRAARGFDRLLASPWSEYADRPFDALEELRGDVDAHYHPTILNCLEHIALGEGGTIEKYQNIFL